LADPDEENRGVDSWRLQLIGAAVKEHLIRAVLALAACRTDFDKIHDELSLAR